MQHRAPHAGGSRGVGAACSISTRFVRLVDPLLMLTAALRQPKCRATRPSSSALALPSTGAARSCASQEPSSSCESRLLRAFRLTFTWMTTVDTPAGTKVRGNRQDRAGGAEAPHRAGLRRVENGPAR